MESIRARRDAALRNVLEPLYRLYEHSEIADPIVTARRYPDPAEREVAAWIAATFAYGRVDQIVKNVRALLAAIGPRPARTLARRTFTESELGFFRHRFHGPRDAADFLFAIGETLRREGSVENFFARRYRSEDGVAGMLSRVSRDLLAFRRPSRKGRSARPSAALRFLLPSPEDVSACKRWKLYLRWMIRADGMDFGLWRAIPASVLVIPADTHVYRVSRRLRLTARKSANWKTAAEITARLARLDPADPVKYDFTICQIGAEICRPGLRLADCLRCPMRTVCPTGKRKIGRAVEARMVEGRMDNAVEARLDNAVEAPEPTFQAEVSA